MTTFLRTYRYELIAALVGASVMMVEIIGARFIAPYFGTSTFVWTAMIGVILGALSVGYWYGGKIADRSASHTGLSLLITFAAGLLLVALLALEPVLGLLAGANLDLRLSALIAAIVLFAPASTFMGAVSPYLVKLKLSSIETAGRSVGQMYAAGTLGSIFGTFAAGYFLIGLFGSLLFGYLIVLALIAISFAADPRSRLVPRLALAGITIVCMALFAGSTSSYKVVYDTDSSYARYQVVEQARGNRTLRILKMDQEGAQSGVYTDAPEQLAFAYTERFVEAAEAAKPKSILMIGGGAFTVPRVLAEADPDVRIDVVEIDPKLTDIAKEYFFFKDNPRIHIINQDGRTYINESSQKYDLIFMDAFSSLTPPFQLTTLEATRRLADRLHDNGTMVVNLINAVEGPGSAFYTSEYKTYQQVFPYIKSVQAMRNTPPKVEQNIIMVASRNGTRVNQVAGALDSNSIEAPDMTDAMVLRDDYAPVEHLLQH